MYNKSTDKIWAERQAKMPSCLSTENLDDSVVEFGLEHEEEETKFFIEHSAHGMVVLKHVAISEEAVELSHEHRSWTRDTISPYNEMLKWEYHLVCKNCHKSLVVVDENTPAELRGI